MIEDYKNHPHLSKIIIVMIETSHPGNIGAVARAMKNMGLSKLILVKPKEFPSCVASARASSAADILNDAIVVNSFDEAVAGCQLVVGSSARQRTVSWPQMDVRETATMAKSVTGGGGQIALVFGRENSGLNNEEMDKCRYLAHIPSNQEYSSLNIAAAVQVFAYECLMAVKQDSTEEASGYRHDLASAEQLEGFYGHLYQALQDIEFLDPAKNARFMRRMRCLFNRSLLDIKEVDILRGILTAAQRQSKKLLEVKKYHV